jgi:hypothetical protein
LALIREKNDKWFLEISSFTAPLQKGLRIVIDPAIILWKDNKPPKQAGKVECRLVEWQYRIQDKEEASLEFTVEEVREWWLDRVIRTGENKLVAGIMLALFLLAPLGIATYLAYYDPDSAWAFAGTHIRNFVGIVLLVLFVLVIPHRFGLYRRGRVRDTFLWALIFYVGLILFGVWRFVSEYPESFTGSPQEYATYAKALVTKFSSSYWPVLLAALPWAAVAFKVFGFEIAEKTTDALKEAGKPHEHAS